MTYGEEYNDAVQRLNVQERVPSKFIPRSMFPIPRKDTPYNFNRILVETLNTPLPKYSIPQRLYISGDDHQTYYNFPLDKQFTLAKGGRKSIAIRKTYISTRAIDISYNIHFKADNWKYKEVGDENEYTLTVDETEGYVWQYTNMANFIDMLKQAVKMFFTDKVIPKFHTPNNHTVYVNLNSLGNKLLVGISNISTVEADKSTSLFYIECDSDYWKYITKWKRIDFDLTQDYNPYITASKRLLFSSQPVSFDEIYSKSVSICSTINPWSPRNIIAGPNDTYTVLNKLFPYDNQQEIKIWFMNSKGDNVYNAGLYSGYIDLELIIDNENNFAIDQD